jgi:hypothetical protein
MAANLVPIRAREIDVPAKEPLRPVDVAQISDSDVRSLRVAQLNEPGLVAGGGRTLSQKIAAMQVTPLPPPRLRSSDRAKFLAEAPTQMMVRIGATAVGKVDFRMTDGRTIDVRLSGLLDLLANGYDRAEFARLRDSAAADAYVSFDKLRSIGLKVRYDPAYDEVAHRRLTAVSTRMSTNGRSRSRATGYLFSLMISSTIFFWSGYQ